MAEGIMDDVPLQLTCFSFHNSYRINKSFIADLIRSEHTRNPSGIQLCSFEPSTHKIVFASSLEMKRTLDQLFQFASDITNCARMIRNDIDEAGIVIEKEQGHVGFHSLRHTFGSMLAASGVHPILEGFCAAGSMSLVVRFCTCDQPPESSLQSVTTPALDHWPSANYHFSDCPTHA